MSHRLTEDHIVKAYTSTLTRTCALYRPVQMQQLEDVTTAHQGFGEQAPCCDETWAALRQLLVETNKC